MDSFINKERPTVFCPGCSHNVIVKALDRAFLDMKLSGNDIVLVSDIGCSGLFDTFFNTHAFHGLHGRALTYATGIKLASPKLRVIVTMGDGGIGIGGAHLLAACRRNVDITLLLLNNFNFGMTGGQFSSTTPNYASVGSGFLNRLEQPFDICGTAISAGASFAKRCSAYEKNLPLQIESAINHKGFSIVDIWGICPGRYTKKNKLTKEIIEEELAKLPEANGAVPKNKRKEYAEGYMEIISELKPAKEPLKIIPEFDPVSKKRNEIIILGNAGQRIITAGEILCYAGLSAGLFATQKSDYNITVLKGHSITEVIFSDKKIEYTGAKEPTVVLALASEGVLRKRSIFANLKKDTIVIAPEEVELPNTNAKIIRLNFKESKIKSNQYALFSIAVMAKLEKTITKDMLYAALKVKFNEKIYNESLAIIEKIDSEIAIAEE